MVEPGPATRCSRLHGLGSGYGHPSRAAHRGALVLAAEFYFLWPVPAVTALTAYLIWRWIEAGREVPGSATIALFFSDFSAGDFQLSVSCSPSLTVWDTAAAPASQIFMLLGTLFLLPIVLGYVGFIYWLFRGKVREGESYH